MSELYQMHQSISKQVGDKLNQFSMPFLQHFGVTHFYHYKMTASGKFASIGSNQDWHERLYAGSEGYGYRVLPYLRKIVHKNGGVFFTQATSDENWLQMADIASKGYGIHFGIQIMQKNTDGFDGFGFSLDSSDPIRHMQFFNDLPQIRSFINAYRATLQPENFLIENLSDISRLIGPFEPDSDSFKVQRQFLKKMRVEVPHPFTKRETEVIREVVKGCTAAEIADSLLISKRTVEHHIERIKDRLDCSTKSSLIQKIYSLQAIGYNI